MRGILLSEAMARRHAALLARLRDPGASNGDPVEAVLIPEGESGVLPEADAIVL